MAIKCALTEPQVDFVYKLTKSAIEEKLNTEQPFDISSYMNYLYERVKKSNGSERAAQFLAEAPKVMEKVIQTNFTNNLENFVDIGKITELKLKFSQEDAAIDNVISYFEGANKVDVEQNKLALKNSKDSTPLDNNPKFDGTVRLLADTVLSGTLPAFKTVTRGEQKFDEPDVERIIINRNLESIINSVDLQDGVLKDFTYQDRVIKLKAVNLFEFTRINLDSGMSNMSKLDSTTRREIARSITLKRRGQSKPGVTQVSDMAIILVTDENGNPLSFDSAGNIVEDTDSEGKFVFQFMRNIKKTKGGYSIKDIYGLEERLETPSKIASIRAKANASKSQEEHLKDVMSELDFYYKVKSNALVKDVMLDFVGMTPGVNASLKSKDYNLAALLENKVIGLKNLRQLKFLKRKELGFRKGTTLIPINGQLYYLDRNRLPENIAGQIVDVMLNPSIDFTTKSDFYNQFIPENGTTRLSYSMRRHKIIPNTKDDSFGVQIYTKVGDEKLFEIGGWETVNGKTNFLQDQLKIDESGVYYYENGEYKLAEGAKLEEYKSNFFDALVRAYTGKGAGATFMAYSALKVKNPDSFTQYIDGKFPTSNYFDFILSKPSKVTIAPSQNDLYNKQLIFKEPNEASRTFKDKGIDVPTSNPQSSEVKSKPITPKQNKKDTDSFNDLLDASDDLFERASSIKNDKVTKEDIKRANEWWNSDIGKEFQKVISLNQVANIVNSDAYATFATSATRLMSPDILGTITINKSKGTMVDVYHEAFHAFTQLYLTREEKKQLYGAVMNYTNKNGNKPYETRSPREIEEILAEDFRSFMKNKDVKAKTPLIKRIFRKILKMLQALLGKINPPSVKAAQLDVMSIPMVKELYENLGGLSKNSPQFLNKYQASLDNARFFYLERGITYADKFGNEKVRRAATTKQEGDDVVSAMDSIISSAVDDIYKSKAKGTDNPNLKGVTIGALLNPKVRGRLYKHIYDKLNSQLSKLSTQYTKSTGGTLISKINTFEELEKAKVGVIKQSNGKNKYILLRSQIDNFENLNPNIKFGERAKGETYYAIDIVGDFFTHKTIKDENGKGFADIIVVGSVEDAELQYDNFVQGGAKSYKDGTLELKNVEEKEETPEEATLYDNIRILQTALQQYGDPFFFEKGENPTGTIAYHIKNSDFEISRAKYFVESESEKEDIVTEDELEDGSLQSIDPEFFDNKKSLLDLADNEVVYILKSLHEVSKNGQESLDRFGIQKRADFRKTWNIVSKTIGGVQNRLEAYNILKKEAKTFPVLNQLIESKLPSPIGLTNSYAYDVSASFWHTFARPSAKFWQLSVYERPAVTAGGPVQLNFQVVESTPSVNKIMLNFESFFKMGYSPFIGNQKDTEMPILLISSLLGDLGMGQLKQSDYRKFLSALGIRLDNTAKITEELNENYTSEIKDLFEFTKEITNLLTLENTELAVQQRVLINKFLTNPIDVIRNKDSIFEGKKIKLLKNYDNLSELRIDTALKSLAALQSKYGFDSPGETIKLPDGNKAYSVVNHSTTTSILNGINSLKDLSQGWKSDEFTYLSHFNPAKNFFTNRSKYIDSAFELEDSEGVRKRKEGISLDLVSLAGTEYISADNEIGLNTSDLTGLDKFFQNLNMMLTKGIAEFTRHAEKKSAYGILPTKKIKVVLPNGMSAGINSNLWIDTDLFEGSRGERVAIEGFMLDYIASEFDRIEFFAQKENADVLKTTKGYNRIIKGEGTIEEAFKRGDLAGQNFTAFEDMLSEDIQNDLKKLANDPEFNGDIKEYILENRGDLLNPITKSLTDYFNTKTNSVERNLLNKIPFEENKDLFGFLELDEEALAYTNQNVTSVLKAYEYNKWITQFEMFNLVNGDIAQFNHAKKQATKRTPGSTSNGDSFLFDQYAQSYINDVWNKNTYQSKEFPGTTPLNFEGHINVGVMDDPIRVSIYLSDMRKSWEAGYKKLKLSKKERDARLEADSKPYTEMQEADGAAYLTMDAYRMLKKLGGPKEWSSEQEALYQDIINERDVDPLKVKEFFPVYKLHYYGPILNAKINTTAMLKFAVAPIIPSVATPETELYKLHEKMMTDNIQMMSFSSGSKVSIMTQNGEFDDIFQGKQQKYVNEDAKITINEMHVRYLKDVTKVPKVLKDYITLGTQDRVISLSTLYDQGELVEGIDPKVASEYEQAVDNLTNVYRDELMSKIGYTYKNGKYQGDVKNLIALIRNDLSLKDIPEQIISMLDVSLNDQLKHDFSIIPIAETIEKIIMNRISKALVNQKTKGEKDIQVPSTFYNGLWDSKYALDKAIADNIEQQKRFLGSNTLPSYRLTKDGIKLAKIAHPFVGDFVNLLNLKWKGKNDEKATKIGTLKRLNELIKEDDFMEEHGDKVTIAGPRIPTDEINLKEAFEIWHFIDPAAGNTVVVPTEIVAKAGSDFDVDALFFSFPNIKKDGTLPTDSPTASLLERKKFAQNEWIRTSVNIIKQPSNYGPLTKPTSTYLIEDETERFYNENSVQYDPNKKNVQEHLADNYYSASRVFDTESDIAIHTELLGGNRPLGLYAKKKKQHVLYKSIGAKLPLTYLVEDLGYGKTAIERDFVLHFDHQKTDKGNISLSHAVNTSGYNIGDIFSHGLQGILDRANNPFISKAGIVREVIPVLNRLIESGVNLQQALAFVNQPLIADYIIQTIESTGFVQQTIAPISDSAILQALASNLTKDTLEVLNDAYTYSNQKRVLEVLDDMTSQKFDKPLIVTIFGKQYNYKNIQDFNTRFNADKSKIQRIILTDKSEIFKASFLGDSPSLTPMRYEHYYISEYLWNKAYGKKEPTSTELESNIKNGSIDNIEQLALLAHYFQIKDQSSGMEELEIYFSPDTANLDTLVSVQNRDDFIERLKNNSKVDNETLERMTKDSIISSMYLSKEYSDVIKPLFSLRMNENIMAYTSITLDQEGRAIRKRFGPGYEGKTRYINAFNNAIIDYIYQNTLSNMTDEYNLPVSLPEEYKGGIKKVTEKEMSTEVPVKVDLSKGLMEVDLKALKRNFTGKFFLSNKTGRLSYNSRGLDTFAPEQNPFDTFDSFVHYEIEKAYLYDVYSLDEFKNEKAYETFISKRALINTFNRSYIMGNGKYSYTRDVLAIIKKNPTLLDRFPVTRQLSESFFGKRLMEDGKTAGLSLLELKDKDLIDGATANEYYKNLKQLANPAFVKNEEITDVFKNFSLMMFYQQGIGKSKISFSKVLDGEAFSSFMNNSANTFIAKVFTPQNSKNFRKLLNDIHQNIINMKGYKNYLKPTSAFLGKNIEDTELPEYENDQLKLLQRQLSIHQLNGDIELATKVVIEMEMLKKKLKGEGPKTDIVVSSDAKDYTGISGGAGGTDTFMRETSKQFGTEFKEFKIKDYDALTDEKKKEVEAAYKQAAKDLGRKFVPVNGKGGKLLRRDYLQADEADAVFAVGNIQQPGELGRRGFVNTTDKAVVDGGTGYAVQFAITMGKPVFVFDQRQGYWFKWVNAANGSSFVRTEVPKLTKRFAAIGTRQLEEQGKAGILSLFNNTFSKKDDTKNPEKPETPEEKPPQSKSKTGLTFNKGQLDAINKMESFLKGDDKAFVLIGKAGTGKTTIMKEVLMRYKDKNKSATIQVGALSHKAVKVLEEALGNDPKLNYTKGTIASILDLILDNDPTSVTYKKFIKNPYVKQDFKKRPNLFIIDESSMVTEKAMEDLFKEMAPNAKIIFLGDKGQLPPIREYVLEDGDVDKDSPTFDIENSANLTERVRQGEESPILPYADKYWDNSDSESPVQDPVTPEERKTVITTEGNLIFKDGESAIRIAIDEFKKSIETDDFNRVKYIAYRNARRNAINNFIHKAIHGAAGNNLYLEKTPLIFMEGYTTLDLKRYKQISYDNSSEVVIRKSLDVEEDEYGVVTTSLLVDDQDEEGQLNTIKVVNANDPSNVIKHKSVINDLWNAFKQTKRGSRERKDALETVQGYTGRYAKVDLAYAITSHKSQGSTYNTAIVDETDITGIKPTSNKAKSQAMYTAITRAKNNVIIISNKAKNYEGEVTLIDASERKPSVGPKVNASLAEFFNKLDDSQKMLIGSLEDLQKQFDDSARQVGEGAYTMEMYLEYLEGKCKL